MIKYMKCQRKNKSGRTSFRAGLLVSAAVIIMLFTLTGCGGGSTPTLGHPNAGYKGFETLKEAAINSSDGRNSIQLFIPEGDAFYTSDEYASGYKSGVQLSVDLVDEYTMESCDNDIEKIANSISRLNSENPEAAEDVSTDFKAVSDGNTLVRNNIQVMADYDNTYYGICRTEFFSKVNDENFITGMVEIYFGETDDSTDQVIKEIEQFYNIDVYRDKEKADERSDYYNAHPPTTHRVYVGNCTMSIPIDWSRDAENSTDSVTAYGPDGNSDADRNLLTTSKSIDAVPDETSETEFKKIISDTFSGMKPSFKKTDSPLKDSVCYYATLSNGKRKLAGYFVFTDYRLTALYTQYPGEKLDDEAKTRLDTAFNSLKPV